MEDVKDSKKNRKLGMLAEIASMYYEQDMTQSEIAKEFCISRTRISRLLKSAKENNIVDIQINYVGERAYELEDIIKRKYSLKEVIVINNQNCEYEHTLRQMGEKAARYIESKLCDIKVIGISWGRSLAQVVEMLKGTDDKEREIVQIIGGAMIENHLIDIPELIRRMVSKFNAKGYRLNAPLYIEDDKTRETLKNVPIIHNTLNKAKNSDVIVTGIGNVSQDTFSFMWSGFDIEEEFEEIKRLGGCGFICAQAYDIHGNEISSGFNKRVIGISLQELKEIKDVIGVSGGKSKAAAVLGALKGGYINALITDRECIKEVLKLEH